MWEKSRRTADYNSGALTYEDDCRRNTARDSLDALDQLSVLFLMIWRAADLWANSVYRIGFGRFTLFQFFPIAFQFLGSRPSSR